MPISLIVLPSAAVMIKGSLMGSQPGDTWVLYSRLPERSDPADALIGVVV